MHDPPGTKHANTPSSLERSATAAGCETLSCSYAMPVSDTLTYPVAGERHGRDTCAYTHTERERHSEGERRAEDAEAKTFTASFGGRCCAPSEAGCCARFVLRDGRVGGMAWLVSGEERFVSFLFPLGGKGAEGGGVRVFLLLSAAPLWCLGKLRGTTWGVCVWAGACHLGRDLRQRVLEVS